MRSSPDHLQLSADAGGPTCAGGACSRAGSRGALARAGLVEALPHGPDAVAVGHVHRQRRGRVRARVLHDAAAGAPAAVRLPAPAARHRVLRRAATFSTCSRGVLDARGRRDGWPVSRPSRWRPTWCGGHDRRGRARHRGPRRARGDRALPARRRGRARGDSRGARWRVERERLVPARADRGRGAERRCPPARRHRPDRRVHDVQHVDARDPPAGRGRRLRLGMLDVLVGLAAPGIAAAWLGRRCERRLPQADDYFGERDRTAGGWLADAPFIGRSTRAMGSGQPRDARSSTRARRSRRPLRPRIAYRTGFDGLVTLERARMLTGRLEPVELEGEGKLTVYVGAPRGSPPGRRRAAALPRDRGSDGPARRRRHGPRRAPPRDVPRPQRRGPR